MHKTFKLLKLLFFGIVFLTITNSFLYSQHTKFKITTQIKTTPVKDQAKSGTCWSFATISFLESELLRMGKGEFDLSEMYMVSCAYPMKADDYMRWHGNNTFAPGGQAHDVMNVIRQYGIVPDSVYPGFICGAKKHNHDELDGIIEAIMKTYIKQDKPSLLYKKVLGSVLDDYLGDAPTTFNYMGKTYTPKSFTDYLGIKPDNYIEITSFNHHPGYSQFVLEVPDNWSKDLYYNVPMDDLIQVIDNALKNGYTVTWDGDVSENDYEFSNGYLNVHESSATITADYRQKLFDEWITTDDHLMHITGIATDEDGNKYYLTKNSWGSKIVNDGYLYLSENFVRLKTIAIMVHKKSLPREIEKKLDIE